MITTMSSHPEKDAVERSEQPALSGLATSTCSAWREMPEAPTDGTEVVGWIPAKGHVLMRFRDGWEFYNRVPSRRTVGHYTMGWSRPGTQPTAWRKKCERSTEWIF